jgi:hypothetical protein
MSDTEKYDIVLYGATGYTVRARIGGYPILLFLILACICHAARQYVAGLDVCMHAKSLC